VKNTVEPQKLGICDYAPKSLSLALVVVLGGCASHYYHDAITKVRENDDGWYQISAKGDIHASPEKVLNTLVMRAAETTLEKGKPFFALSKIKEQSNHKYKHQNPYNDVGGQYLGLSHQAYAKFYPIAKEERAQWKGDNIHSAEKVCENFKNLRRTYFSPETPKVMCVSK